MKAIYKSCKWCGSIHKEDYVCNRKPPSKKHKNAEYSKFQGSSAWKRKREEIKKRDKYLCQVCVRNLYNPKYQYQYENLEVHHAIPVVDWDAGHLDNSNLLTLCSEHHHMADSYEIREIKTNETL